MSPPLSRITSDERLPAQADVVVIGGGVIGASAAYHLAKKGHSVALIEKGHVGAEQSSRNWGWCRQQGRARAEIPLAREALRLWEDMQNDAGIARTAGSFIGLVARRGRRTHARQCRYLGRRPAHAE
jgi:glycine/D-amino acid oxidase-like deaminating enzyme